MILKVLGIASSMREQSYSTATLKIILEMVRENGAEIGLLDLRQTQLPMYGSDNGQHQIDQVTDQVKWADAFILATPDYHGSMSGTMKNFLDYFWSEFAGKTFGYLCASHEKGLTVMDQMRTAIRQCYGWSMPYGVSIDSGQDFHKSEITNPKLVSRLQMLARDLVVYGVLIRQQFLNDLNSDIHNTLAARYRQ